MEKENQKHAGLSPWCGQPHSDSIHRDQSNAEVHEQAKLSMKTEEGVTENHQRSKCWYAVCYGMHDWYTFLWFIVCLIIQ